MRHAVYEGGDYVTHDLRFHQGLLRASGNRMLVQMSKALSALLRTSFEISTRRKDGPLISLPMHRAVLDAIISRDPDAAEAAAHRLITSAGEDIEQVLASRRRLPVLSQPAPRLRAA
jgi:DNA-binding FadR family transcriptional regulator